MPGCRKRRRRDTCIVTAIVCEKVTRNTYDQFYWCRVRYELLWLTLNAVRLGWTVRVGTSVSYYGEYCTWQEGHRNPANAKLAFQCCLEYHI